MILVMIMLLFGFSSVDAMTTTPVKKRPPLTIAQEMAARFGNQVIELTDQEYRQLKELPTLSQLIAPDKTIKAQNLFTILLSNYRLSRPRIYCIRAPCPQPAILVISNDSRSLEINLTDSEFSRIVESFNI